MDQFERRLTESLHTRAEDAEPTPELWSEVRDRFTRRRWLTWTYAIAGAAALVLLAVAVVPGVWDALRGPDRLDILDEPFEPPAAAGDVLLATTDGDRIVLHGLGEPGERPPTGGHIEEGERIESVAIRPGSTRDDVTLVYVVSDGDGAFRLRAERRVDHPDGVRWTYSGVPEELQPSGSTPPAPVWSPDGAHLAWVESPVDQTGPRLRTVTWPAAEPLLTSEGDEDDAAAATVAEPDDATSHQLVGGDLPVAPIRLDAWSWTELVAPEDAYPEADGRLVLTGGFAAVEVAIQRGADGTLALGAISPVDRDDASLLAAADGGPDLSRFVVTGGEVPIGPAYELLLDEDERDAPRVVLREQRWPDRSDDVALTDAVWEAVGADPAATWLRAAGDRVLLGTADGVWLFEDVGGRTEPERLDDVVHADLRLLSPGRPVEPVEPTPQVTDEPEAEQTYPDVALLATDGSDVFVIPPRSARDAGARQQLATLPSGHRAVAVAVRPGSTRADLEAVVWMRVGDGHELHRLRYAGENAQLEPLPAPYQISDDVAPGSRPRPVWSPDGAHLAWVELPADETASGPRLRTIGWDDGPGTGDTATDNADFELDDIPLTPVRAEVWTGSVGGDGCPPADTLTLRVTSEQLEAWTVRVQVQPDGSLGLPADAITLLGDDPNGTPVAYAPDARVCDGMSAPYGLYAGEDDGEVLLSVFDPVGHQGFPIPDEVRTAELPTLGQPRDGEGAVWISGLGDVVVVGVDGRAWLTGRPVPAFEERPVPIEGTVVHADPIG